MSYAHSFNCSNHVSWHIFQHAADKYMVVAGNTGGGVYKNDGPYDVFVDVKNVQGFNAVTLSDVSADGLLNLHKLWT